MGRSGWIATCGAVALAGVPFLTPILAGEAPAHLPGPSFADDFERREVGPSWWSTGGPWAIRRGELWGAGARNNPLWLAMPLPRDVAVAFTARSETSTGTRPGDIKVEIFGNGRSAASGYVLIFGGWGNSTSAIARLDEHGADRVERADRRVEPGRTYRMVVERRGRVLRWIVDGAEFLVLDDPAPLAGRGHDRFGFSSWDSDLFFDDLRIERLPAEAPP